MARYIDEFNLLSSKELRKKRLDICSTCGYKRMRFGASYCQECGCLLKAKVLLKKEQCPLDKWVSE